jgi:hypothetical protein
MAGRKTIEVMALKRLLARLLLHLTVGISLALFLLVLLSPLLDNESVSSDGWQRLVAIFARDATVRRTVIASAIGLLVTACVFFRPAEPSRPVKRKRKQPGPSPPPAGAAGA